MSKNKAGLWAILFGRSNGSAARTRQLWDREFTVVKEGLAEKQVVTYVEELRRRYEALVEEKKRTTDLGGYTSKVLAEADQAAEDIKAKARAEAQSEAVRIVADARQKAEAILEEAKKDAAAKSVWEVQDILAAAQRKADIVEAEAHSRAQVYLLEARERIQSELQKEIQDEAKNAYSRLLSSLQELLTTAEKVEAEWKVKTNEPRPQETLVPLEGSGVGFPEPPPAPTTEVSELPQEAAPEAPLAEEEEDGTDQELTLVELNAMEEPLTTAEAELPQEAAPEAPLEEEEEDGTDQELTLVELNAMEDPLTTAEAELPQEAAPEAPPAEEEEDGTDQGFTVEEPDALEEPLTTAEAELPQEAAPEAPPAEEPVAAKEEGTGREPTEEELNTLYSSEVELVLTPPINAAAMSRLYNELLSNPEVRIIRTGGSWAQGTTITVFLDRPLPLLGLLAKIPDLRPSTWVKAEGRGRATAEKKLDNNYIGITMASAVPAGEAAPGAR